MEIIYGVILPHFPLTFQFIMLADHILVLGELLRGDRSILDVLDFIACWSDADMTLALRLRYREYEDI
jgi:hypothetical protein